MTKKMLTLSDYVVLALLVTQSSCYTLVGPKLYSQSLPASSRGWSNIVPYPFRTYQPSIPVQYYGRYFGDPYFPHNLQNPDYYFTQDPYSPSFEDSDYYSNYLYYIPADRRVSYYDPAIMDPLDEIQDYDEEPADDSGISKSQREWWLEKNVAPNEDIDLGQINQIDDVFGKNAKTSKKQKSKSKDSRKASPRNRYAGIDGFGRKKDKEQVFGNYRPNVRKEKERTWVYGVPSVRSEYEDRDVQELKSLLKNPNVEEQRFGGTSLADWASGNAKRSAGTVKNPEGKENSSTFKDKFVAALKPMKIVGPYSVYDEGGKEDMPEEVAEESNWTSNYVPEETSVFDTIKKLLALEDKVNRVSQVRTISYYSVARVIQRCGRDGSGKMKISSKKLVTLVQMEMEPKQNPDSECDSG